MVQGINVFSISISRLAQTDNTNTGSFLQTPFWSEFKAAHGWNYSRFSIRQTFREDEAEKPHSCGKNASAGQNAETEKTGEFSVLTRSFAHGLFSIAYIPLFPQLPFECTPEETIEDALDSDETTVIEKPLVTAETQTIEFAHLVKEIAAALKPYLPKNTICIRFDPAVSFGTPEERDAFNYGLKRVSFADRLHLRKNSVDIQPPDSTLVDLTPDTEEILERMKSKWRYNIRLSERKGVQIEKVTGADPLFSEKLDVVYDLYKITSERDGIAIHSKSYYEDLLKKSSDELAQKKDVPAVTLYLAKHEDDYLGAIITLFSRTESVYLYGCSSNVKRNLMPNFLLQWTAMQDAKKYGSLYYDMYGMPPTDDENHPMHGLYLFKTGFGGKNIHRIGTFDVPVHILYRACIAAESMRAFWHKKIMKKIRGR